jgi:dephospho-CoA kinase
MRNLAEKFGKITDPNEKLKSRIELEGLLGKNNDQLDKLEDMSDLIIADENLQQEVSKRYKFPSDAIPAIISGRLQNLTDSYVRISLVTVKEDLDSYVQEKTKQSI